MPASGRALALLPLPALDPALASQHLRQCQRTAAVVCLCAWLSLFHSSAPQPLPPRLEGALGCGQIPVLRPLSHPGAPVLGERGEVGLVFLVAALRVQLPLPVMVCLLLTASEVDPDHA